MTQYNLSPDRHIPPYALGDLTYTRIAIAAWVLGSVVVLILTRVRPAA